LIHPYRWSGPLIKDSNKARICKPLAGAIDHATLTYMQEKKGAQLRKEWAEKGNPSCEHPVLDKEYFLGADSGDLICATCGEVWERNNPDRPGTARYPKPDRDS
jgi:hypothetical protein